MLVGVVKTKCTEFKSQLYNTTTQFSSVSDSRITISHHIKILKFKKNYKKVNICFILHILTLSILD